jgi:hypothetical protein
MSKNPMLMLVIFSAAAAWQIYDIASATEAPSRAVMILQYVFLAGLLLGIAGTAYNALGARQHQRQD